MRESGSRDYLDPTMLIKLNGSQQDSRARGHDHVAEPHAMAAGTRVRVRSDLARLAAQLALLVSISSPWPTCNPGPVVRAHVTGWLAS